MRGKRNLIVPCDGHKRNKHVKMKMVGTTVEQNVDDVLESKTELWYKEI